MMKKILLGILFSIGILSTSTVFALSYNGVATYSDPFLTFSGVSTSSEYIATSPDVCYGFFLSNRCQRYFVVGGYSQYHKYSPGTFLDETKNLNFGVVEVDFSEMTSTGGPYLIFNGEIEGGYDYDIYLSGSSAIFRLWYNGSDPYTLIKTSEFFMPSIPSNYSDINFGGFYPKKAVFSFQLASYAKNDFLIEETYIQKLLFQRITNDSRHVIIDYTNSGSTLGYKISNTFIQYPISSYGDAFFTCSPYCSDLVGFQERSFFPYVFTGANAPYGSNQYSPNLLKGNYYTFSNIQNFIDNNNGNSLPFVEELAKFYSGTGSLETTSNPIGGDSGNDFFSACTSFLDVGCYVKATWYTFTDWIFGFFPDITWTGQSYGCTSSGSSSPIGYTGSSTFIQNIVNVLAIISPFPPPEGSEMCLVGRTLWDPMLHSSGGLVTIHYQHILTPETKMENGLSFFDVFIMIIMGIVFMNTFRKSHTGGGISNQTTTGSK